MVLVSFDAARTRALILPLGQIFCQTTGEKSGTVIVGKRKKNFDEQPRDDEQALEGNDYHFCERIPVSPLFSFSRKTLFTILDD